MYYMCIRNGEIIAVREDTKHTLEEFLAAKEKAEQSHCETTYELVPESMEKLAKYAIDLGQHRTDFHAVLSMLEDIEELARNAYDELDAD